MDKTNDTIAGLRFQKYDSGEVHVHDDSHGKKFIAKADSFKTEMAAALESLHKVKDGTMAIYGKGKEILYLVKDDNNLHVFVSDSDDDITGELKTFIKKL